MTARQMSSSSFHYPTKVLNFIDTRPKDNEVKGAVKLDPMLREYLLSAAVEESSSDDSSSSIDQSFVAFPQQKLANAIPTTFAVFDKQDQPLSDFVAQLCSQMGLLGADEEQKAAAVDGRAAVRRHFALMFDDRRSFLTEANKHGLQQGFILKLTASPSNYARHFLTKLGSSRRPLSADQLSLLNSMCADCAFAEAFHQQQGIQRLANMIEEAADWHPFFDSNGSGSLLLGLMHALLQLMQMYPQLVPWSSISSQFVRKIAFLVNGQSKLEQNDSRALALDMLLVLAEHCDHLHECLKREVPVDSLIRHLDNTDQRVLLGSTRLMNAIYVLGERAERICIVKLLHERPFLAAIGRVLAREGSSSIPGSSQVGGPAAAARTSTATTSPPPPSLPPSPISEQRAQLWEQLARLQHIRFDEVRALALRSPSDMEIDFLKKLEAFNGGIAGDDLFESAAAYGNDGAEAAEEGNLYSNIVGFQQQKRQQSSDWEQFREIVRSTPPGLLAICAILDLTQPPQPAAILQQQQQQSPEEAASAAAMAANQAWARLQELDAHFIGRPSLFPQILARLAQMLLQVLGICGESSVGQRFGHQRLPHFWRLVLTCERPFYDLFRTVVELFYRTWRDMNAKPEELGKVFSVVQDQLERAMVEDPESLEQLEREMLRKRFSYFNMQKIWKREQLEQEELELNSEDIQPLRDHLRPKFERLVLQKRISLLKRGLTFQRVLPAKPKDPQNTPNLSSSPASSLSTASLAFSSSTAVHSSPVHSGHVNLHQQQPQHWFWRLDERERHFHVWDCGGGKHKELVLDSQEKLPISQIRAVLHGPELVSRLQQQHGLKPQKKGQNVLRCGLGLETQLAAAQEYFLCAQTEQELASWLEALNCLCWPQKALENAALRAEVDRLLGMEVHIRLMDIPPQQPKHKKSAAAEVPGLPTDLQSWIPQNMLLQPERA